MGFQDLLILPGSTWNIISRRASDISGRWPSHAVIAAVNVTTFGITCKVKTCQDQSLQSASILAFKWGFVLAWANRIHWRCCKAVSQRLSLAQALREELKPQLACAYPVTTLFLVSPCAVDLDFPHHRSRTDDIGLQLHDLHCKQQMESLLPLAILHFTQIFSTETQLPPHNTIGTVLFASIDHAVVTDGVLERLELRSGMPNYSTSLQPMTCPMHTTIKGLSTTTLQISKWLAGALQGSWSAASEVHVATPIQM